MQHEELVSEELVSQEEVNNTISEVNVEFYPENNIGTIKEEVSNALGNEIE